MRAAVVRSLLVIGAGAAVLAGVLYVASTVDTRPPEVLGIAVTVPVAGDPSQALITTSIEITFSEPVDSDGAASAIRIEPTVAATASWSGTTLILTPADPLELSTAYVVHVDPGIRDLAGNEMSERPAPFRFETAGRPRVTASEPADGSEGVAVDEAIGITFSTLMDTAAVEADLRVWPAIRYELRWAGERLEIVPSEPLRPGTDYEVSLGRHATDAAGVAIGEPFTMAFRTVDPGLRIERLIPAEGVDGIAPATAIAIIFDRPIDALSIEDGTLRITPDVAGSVDVTALPGETDGEASGRLLRFTPSGPLPANTTFEVEVSPEIASAVGGGRLAEPVTWRFTTGAPAATLSNQITFVTDRSGVSNVWAMNPDGTGQHQVSAELTPVLDYAVAPDGTSLLVADGRRLVFLRADGADRRLLTADEHWEFDPAYDPSGRSVAFGRADAETGQGLGLWQWEVGGGNPQRVDLPDELGASPSPTDGGLGAVLRAPRYSPDGLALAFVDTSGAVGLLELPAQRLTRVAFAATAAPAWTPNSGAVLLAGRPLTGGPIGDGALDAPVDPLEPGPDDGVHRLSRSGTATTETALGAGWRLLAVAVDGTIAYVTDEGRLGTTAIHDEADPPLLIADARIIAAAFAPGEQSMVIVVAGQVDGDGSGAIERLDLGDGQRSPLAPEGRHPRWHP